MNILNKSSFLFFEMKIIHLILMMEFVIVRGGNQLSNLFTVSSTGGIGSHRPCVDPKQRHFRTLLDNVRMAIVDDNDIIQHVDLTLSERVLANENLPVWMVNGIVDTDDLDNGKGDELELDHEVMNRLGKFTPYQDADTSSAAMYFHKRREYDGMIGYEFFIRKLSIGSIHPTTETLIPLGVYGVHRRLNYVCHKIEMDTGDEEEGVNYQKHLKTYGGHVYNGFPEILVIVSWDIQKHWAQEYSINKDEKYTAIVSHVLTLFNGVDMLYAKLKKTNIKINIAGIIIEKEKNSFSFLQQCQRYSIGRNNQIMLKWLGGCINKLFEQYLSARKGKIPNQSYDSVIYLTRKKLYSLKTDGANNRHNTFVPVAGIARCPIGLYNLQRHRGESILVASITSEKNFDEYPTIAHELAHLLSVLHDGPPFFNEDGTCSGHLMKPNADGCPNCLSWSETSEKSFSLFFSSPNCCVFINEPISLHPPGRHMKLTADEQCQCYGYVSAMVFDVMPEDFCEVKLRCIELDNEIHETLVPMDGTSCLANKVCRQMKCVDVQIYEDFKIVNQV